MSNQLSYLSEDDIRTKVVYQWLKDCGLNDSDIIIEYTIKFRLGKGIKTINSRTDVLIKNINGQNLLIVEVKRPDHSLNDSDKQQAISYARALAEGGIAPFSILTNGKDSLIYDSVTGEEVSDNSISSDHPYVKNGFYVSGDAIHAKAEALEYLITISTDNLLTFCKAQVKFKMALLRSEDLYSGKKYIPQLYIDRKQPKEELKSKLFDKKSHQIILVVGPPQHGKTCFLCNTVESYLEQDIPVLFYPAISLKKGLLHEIKEDFEWMFGEELSSSLIVNRLRRISEQLGKKILLFIDGWNEMLDFALIINDECQRLQLSNIQIVLSTTSPSLTRLLQDETGNSTYIANETKLNIAAIRKLTKQPLANTKEINIIQIGTFNESEIRLGKKVYERAYNTSFSSEDNLPKDPFYLRLASEIYMNNSVPIFATRTDLIQNSLIQKGIRRGISEIELFTTLNDLCDIILKNDTPFDCTHLPLGLRTEKSILLWIESAILLRTHELGLPKIDFYYTHDKDYCIAILNRKLPQLFANSSNDLIYKELEYIIATESGQSALRWLMSCPEYAFIIEKIFQIVSIKAAENNTIISLLTNSILVQIQANNNLSFRWLEQHIHHIISIQLSNENEEKLKSDLSGLIFSLLNSLDVEKETEKYEFWMRLLVKYDASIDDLGVSESLICQFYGEDDIKDYFNTSATSLDIDLFERLVLDNDNEIARNAAMVLSYALSIYFLRKVPSYYQYYIQNNLKGIEYVIESSCEYILSELNEMYYGSMCPGWLSHAKKGDCEIEEEYYRQKTLWRPILKIFKPDSELYNRIFDMLRDLSEYLNDEEQDNPPFDNPNQLSFDF